MPKALGSIVSVLLLFTGLIGILGLVASSFPTAEADVMPNVVPTTVPTIVVPTTLATIVIPTATVIMPVYVTITQVITSTISFTLTIATTATVTTVATATAVSIQSLTETSTRTVTSLRTAVTTALTTAVGVLGPVVNNVFKRYSDVGMLAAGIVVGTTAVDLVIMLAMAFRAKEGGKDKDVFAQMIEMLQKFEGSVQTDRAKKLEEMLEAKLRAERADLGWLAVLALIIALVILLVILVLSWINGVPCFWC